MRPDPDRLPAAVIAPILQSDPNVLPFAKTRSCWRVARGGRLMLTRVDGLTGRPLVRGDEDARTAADAMASMRRPPPPSQRLGALANWWATAPPSPSSPSAPGTPWASELDLSLLPLCVDGDALLLQRQLQLQQHHAEMAALAALGGDRLGLLGSTNPEALSAAAAAATSAAHMQLQQQLQAAMAEQALQLVDRPALKAAAAYAAAHPTLPPPTAVAAPPAAPPAAAGAVATEALAAAAVAAPVAPAIAAAIVPPPPPPLAST
jgi:hypothetical protein